jgi:hypothetical protein
MKLPSLHFIVENLLQTVRRFPFALTSAVVGSCIAMLMVENDFKDDAKELLVKLLMVCSLALPMFFSLHIFLGRIKPSKVIHFVMYVGAFGLLADFYFSINWKYSHESIYKFFFWNIGLHLMASFSAFFAIEQLNGFWQFNKMLFLRFLTAALYSSVLFIGLAGALLAIDNLFNVNLHSEIYVKLWIFIAGIFNTAFFLGGIPENIDDLQEDYTYPTGLKIFTQYVLLPLVIIYVLILYAYAGKIIMQWDLPKGWVANLIILFSVAGILSLLLVHPIENSEENKWIHIFSRLFYYSIIPLIVLLFISIGFRIKQYGVTIERYIVAELGIWLALITLYFIFSRRKNIILIPLSLFLFVFGSCFGPWGMFKVSERSQVKRLMAIFDKHGLMKDGVYQKPMASDSVVSLRKDREKIQSIVGYLSEYHGIESFAGLIADSCLKDLSSSRGRNRYMAYSGVYSCLGLDDFYEGSSYPKVDYSKSYFFRCSNLNLFQSNPEVGHDVSGYKFIVSLGPYRDYKYDEGSYALTGCFIELDNESVEFVIEGKTHATYNMKKLAATLQNLKLKSDYEAPVELMTLKFNSVNGDSCKFLMEELRYEELDSTINLREVRGYFLYN